MAKVQIIPEIPKKYFRNFSEISEISEIKRNDKKQYKTKRLFIILYINNL